MSANPVPEYYNKEVKRVKVKVSKMYSKKKFGQPYRADLKRLYSGLLAAKKNIFTFDLTKRRQMVNRVL